MSDEKKTNQAAASSAGAAAVGAPVDHDDAAASDARRGRNQNVLPDILGKQLRAAYGELLSSPVPDAIADLIKKLENAQPGTSTAKKAADEEGSK